MERESDSADDKPRSRKVYRVELSRQNIALLLSIAGFIISGAYFAGLYKDGYDYRVQESLHGTDVNTQDISHLQVANAEYRADIRVLSTKLDDLITRQNEMNTQLQSLQSRIARGGQ